MSGASTATAIGMATTAVGGITSAIAQSNQGAAVSNIAQANAAMYNARALQAVNESKARADILSRDLGRKMGATRAAYGASGVDVNSGTPLAVQADQATEAELQRQLILYSGTVDAANFERMGELSLMQGESAQTASRIGAFSTLLTTAGQVGNAYFNSRTGPTIPNPAKTIGGSVSVPAFEAQGGTYQY